MSNDLTFAAIKKNKYSILPLSLAYEIRIAT